MTLAVMRAALAKNETALAFTYDMVWKILSVPELSTEKTLFSSSEKLRFDSATVRLGLGAVGISKERDF